LAEKVGEQFTPLAEGLPEVGVVEKIEELRSKLQVLALAGTKVSILQDREIECDQPRTTEGVAAQVSRGELALGSYHVHGKCTRRRAAVHAYHRATDGVGVVNGLLWVIVICWGGPEEVWPQREPEKVVEYRVRLTRLKSSDPRQLPALAHAAGALPPGHVVNVVNDRAMANIEVRQAALTL